MPVLPRKSDDPETVLKVIKDTIAVSETLNPGKACVLVADQVNKKGNNVSSYG